MTKDEIRKMVIAEARTNNNYAVFCGNRIVVIGETSGIDIEDMFNPDDMLDADEKVPEFGGIEEQDIADALDVRCLVRVEDDILRFCFIPYAENLKIILDADIDIASTPEYAIGADRAINYSDIVWEIAGNCTNGRKINYIADGDYIIIKTSAYDIADDLRDLLDNVDWTEQGTLDDAYSPCAGKYIIADDKKRAELVALIDAYNAAENPNAAEFLQKVKSL